MIVHGSGRYGNAIDEIVSITSSVQLLKGRMGRRYVIALVIHIMKELPVVADLTDAGAAQGDHLGEPVTGHPLFDGMQLLGHCVTARLKPDEDEPLPGFQLQRNQAVLAQFQILKGLQTRNTF